MNYKRICLECKAEFLSRQYSSEFCCAGCRSTFNNRRTQRGAMLYDLMMMERVDDKDFARLHLENRVEMLMAAFVADDLKEKRKRSYKTPLDVNVATAAYCR